MPSGGSRPAVHRQLMLSEVSEPASRAEASSELVRGLGPWQATAVVVSTIIGTGVFLVAGPMARAAGSFDLFLLTWIAGSVIALSGALCFAELGAALPAAGGLYCYLSRGLGPIWGFMYGWMQAVLGSPVGFATIAAGFVRFARDRKSTRLNSSHYSRSRMPSSA